MSKAAKTGNMRHETEDKKVNKKFNLLFKSWFGHFTTHQ